VAQVMSMVAEERAVKSILDHLLSSGSCQIAVVPSEKYVRHGEPLSFWAVAKRAAKYGDVLIGYQTSYSSEKTVLNPPNKAEEVFWDNKDFAVIQGGDEGVNLSDSMVPSAVFKPSSQERSLRMSDDAWNRSDLWTGEKVDGLDNGDSWAGEEGSSILRSSSATSADFKQSVEAAVQTFLRYLPEANETSLQSLSLRLNCSELVSLSDALQVLRCAVSERPWVKPDARRGPTPALGDENSSLCGCGIGGTSKVAGSGGGGQDDFGFSHVAELATM